jgi:hypothetical protein
MQDNWKTRLVAQWLLTLLISGAGVAQDRNQKLQQRSQQQPAAINQPVNSGNVLRAPSGPSFYIAPVEGSAAMFSVLLGDGGGNTVAGTFTLQQIDVFEAVLEEAKVFALNDEKVGSGSPLTTRLMEQHEWSLFVDVSKIGDKSRFFVSLITPQGKLTAPAGEITRGSKKEQTALLLDILSQVRNAKGGMTSSR